MTREEAIKTLKDEINPWICCYEKWNEALAIAIEALEQEPILDKIRAEITKEAECTMNGDRAGGLYKALQIINKYKEKEGINNDD